MGFLHHVAQASSHSLTEAGFVLWLAELASVRKTTDLFSLKAPLSDAFFCNILTTVPASFSCHGIWLLHFKVLLYCKTSGREESLPLPSRVCLAFCG